MKTNFLIVGAVGVKPAAWGPHLDLGTMFDHGEVLASLLDAVAMTITA